MPSPKYVYGAIRGRAFLHRASARKGTANRGAFAPAKPWVWEIHRVGKSGPVERSPVCYASMAEAARDGKKALARLLMAA